MAKRLIAPEVRAICYARDDETCQWTGCGLSKRNGDRLNLHHIVPEQFGGTEDPSNLITLCEIHHKQMHVEFHAFYPDSRRILLKMGYLTKLSLSKLRKIMRVDDGFDLIPYLDFLTGRTNFRPGQLKTIRAAISGKNVLFVTPTGSGKSVTYQLPGLIGDKPSLVISPLKALMKDQVQSIWSKKIPTTYINSDLTDLERQKRYQFIKEGLFKFIFVAPERFASKDPSTRYIYQRYSHLVIDEAHSIDTWGLAFRPSYRQLGAVRNSLGNPPVIALTATASKQTQEQILESLGVQDAEVIVTGFKKDNIEIRVHESGSMDENGAPLDKESYIQRLIEENNNERILIFTPTIEKGKALLGLLRDRGIGIELYHSRLDTKEKMDIQNRFTGIAKPDIKVLISTSAFGMGIDISDIRHVVHLSPTLSVTDYVQQIGRAGRDGKYSYAHLLFGKEDRSLLDYMATLSTSEKGFKEKHNYTDEDVVRVRNSLRQQVSDMWYLTEMDSSQEAWQYILDYFGEVEPTYWDKNGMKVSNYALVGIMVIVVILMVSFLI